MIGYGKIIGWNRGHFVAPPLQMSDRPTDRLSLPGQSPSAGSDPLSPPWPSAQGLRTCRACPSGDAIRNARWRSAEHGGERVKQH